MIYCWKWLIFKTEKDVVLKKIKEMHLGISHIAIHKHKTWYSDLAVTACLNHDLQCEVVRP